MYTRFKKLLEEKGDTIYQVSKDTGIPQSTLYEWKDGKYTPKVDKLVILARYFNVPIEYFIE